jgi:hypothetical protein
LAERAIAMIPIDKDALTGPRPLDILARVAACTGQSDRSISTLETLLSIPYEAPLAANSSLPAVAGRSLLRFSAWIQCLIHCARIRASRNWLPLPRQNRVRMSIRRYDLAYYKGKFIGRVVQGVTDLRC